MFQLFQARGNDRKLQNLLSERPHKYDELLHDGEGGVQGDQLLLVLLLPLLPPCVGWFPVLAT